MWKAFSKPLLTFILCLLAASAATAQAQQSAARQWNEELLSAIRRNVPNPPAHARNLHHVATAMFDAWAAYDTTAVGYLYNEKVSPLPSTATAIEAARAESISYAAYRVLRSRFATGNGAATSLASFDARLTTLGYSTATGQAAITNGTTPAEVGKRIGQAVLTWGAQDGFSLITYPQAYNSAVNPNLALPLSVLGQNLNFQTNMPLGFGLPAGTNPNLWQPLDLTTSVTQNGIPIPGGPQTFVGVQSLATMPFSLTRTDTTKPWLDPFGGPSRLSTPGNPSASDAAYKDNFMDVLRKGAVLNDDTLIDISPGSIGNNPLGADTGMGRATNPVTGLPYAVNPVKRGDFARVLAEFWADGPNSETPPGHWHVLANQVADNPLTVKKIGGTGPTVNDLEWDVKAYLALSGATHDASCAAWALKRYYSGTRPITAIRYMASKGQSSSNVLPSYHSEGLPLETGVVELITTASAAVGQRHEQVWDVAYNSYQPGTSYIDQVVVYAWPGEHPSNAAAPAIAANQSLVRWMLAKDWLPFQRKTFNTPAFPGYVSGHSTFSRSAAEVLTLLTGSANFPGGFGHHTYAANSMQIDHGPSANVDLQWTTYYDAADQAGQSRRYGGIHPYEDDYHGRTIGSQAGISAYTLAEKFWTGSIQTTSTQPSVIVQANGSALITWPATIGLHQKVQRSSNFSTYTDIGPNPYAYTTSGSYTDSTYTPGSVYRILQTQPTAARTWSEQILAAIRIDKPNPPVHARNLFHLGTVIYDCWAAYDTTAIGYIHHERATASDLPSARKEAISYASYRLLKSRYAGSTNAATTMAALDAKLLALGYDSAITSTAGTAPANVGNRIAAAIMTWGLADGSNQAGAYADPSYTNPQPPMVVLQGGIVRGYGIPANTNPNLWQPLAFDAAFTQNGIAADLIQKYVGLTWLNTLPFAHTRTDNTKPWIDTGGPSMLHTAATAPTPQQAASDANYKAGVLDILRASSRLNSTATIDISPAAFGNNPLGTDNGTGRPLNPITGQPYPANIVPVGDFSRVLSEVWADGPNSETPPGHWHVIANRVADKLTAKRIGGTGPIVDDLEWDAKTYFAISTATHDAACAAWSLKRYYQGVRPITAVRHMATMGQSTVPNGTHYSPQGLPLEYGVVEVATDETLANGGRHNAALNAIPGDIVVYGWPGEPTDPATQTSPVRWMRGMDWVPYTRKTFNTPAFPGYVSGHSTFSRAAAEVLTAITGTPYFPDGLETFTAEASSYLIFERGPTATLTLQWATYYDAADHAGISRRLGGIHVPEDDYAGRIAGSQSGLQAWALAKKYWEGNIATDTVIPAITYQSNGSAIMTTRTQRGLYYTVQSTTNLTTWTDLVPRARATGTTLTYTDPNPSSPRKFYRVLWEPAAQ